MFGTLNNRVEQEFKVIDKLNGFDFEEYCAYLLELNGYQKADVTKRVGDYGTDVIAERDGVKFAIQCKRQDADVGISAIQEILSGKTYYGCHVGIVLTNSNFLQHTIDYATQLGIVLWNRENLLAFVVQALLKVYGQIYEHAFQDDMFRLCAVEDSGQVSCSVTEDANTIRLSKMQATMNAIVMALEKSKRLKRDELLDVIASYGGSTGMFERARQQLVRNGIINTVTTRGQGRITYTSYELRQNTCQKKMSYYFRLPYSR